MARYAKLWIALAGAATSGAILITDGWSGADYFSFAAALFTAIGVGLVPNQPPDTASDFQRAVNVLDGG